MNERLRINLEYAQTLGTKSYRIFSEYRQANSAQAVVDLFSRVISSNKLTTRVVSETVPMLRRLDR